MACWQVIACVIGVGVISGYKEFSLALQLNINAPVSTFHPYQQKLE
jgi:hypothetical protein